MIVTNVRAYGSQDLDREQAVFRRNLGSTIVGKGQIFTCAVLQ